VNLVLVRCESRHNSLTDRLSRVATDVSDDRVQRLALDQRDQGTAAAFPYHGVAFPVAQPASGIDNGRALVNRDPVGNDTTTVVGPVALAPLLLTTKMPVQIAP